MRICDRLRLRLARIGTQLNNFLSCYCSFLNKPDVRVSLVLNLRRFLLLFFFSRALNHTYYAFSLSLSLSHWLCFIVCLKLIVDDDDEVFIFIFYVEKRIFASQFALGRVHEQSEFQLDFLIVKWFFYVLSVFWRFVTVLTFFVGGHVNWQFVQNRWHIGFVCAPNSKFDTGQVSELTCQTAHSILYNVN